MLEYESQLLHRDIAELNEHLTDGSQADISLTLEMMENDADTAEKQIQNGLLHPSTDDLEDEVNELEQLVAHLRHLIAATRDAEDAPAAEAAQKPKTAPAQVPQNAAAQAAPVSDDSPSGPSVLVEEPAGEAPDADLELDDLADPDLHDDPNLEPPFHDDSETEEELARDKAQNIGCVKLFFILSFVSLFIMLFLEWLIELIFNA